MKIRKDVADLLRAGATYAQKIQQELTPCAWTALHSACCLTSWESRGHHHDPITCTRKA